MGWTTFHKPNHISPSQYFREEFSSESNHELLDIAIVKRVTAYMAVRIKSTGQVICYVYMLTYNNKDYYNFGYKPMTEYSGPYQRECPERILKLLSPIVEEDDQSGWARQWREECWNRIRNNKNKPKINVGDVIRTSSKLNFTNGGEYDLFKKTDRINVFNLVIVDKDGEFVVLSSTVRLTIKKFDYSILNS